MQATWTPEITCSTRPWASYRCAQCYVPSTFCHIHFFFSVCSLVNRIILLDFQAGSLGLALDTSFLTFQVRVPAMLSLNWYSADPPLLAPAVTASVWVVMSYLQGSSLCSCLWPPDSSLISYSQPTLHTVTTSGF